MERNRAIELLKKYNKEDFHLRHALTVEGVMKYFAKEANEDVDYWGLVGLLHDVDFEIWPEEHCKKTRTTKRNRSSRRYDLFNLLSWIYDLLRFRAKKIYGKSIICGR